jgi:predicted O-methyltransferase YrrM
MSENTGSLRYYVMRDEKGNQGLEDLIKKIQELRDTSEMNMIEIGTYVGESATIFSRHFKNVISVDPYINETNLNEEELKYATMDEVYTKFIQRTRNIMNITNFRVTSDEGAIILKNMKYDFVYIDGIHTYTQVKKDILNYLPLIKKNGFIGGHDYAPFFKHHVVKAVDEILQFPDKRFQDGSWLKKISNIK